MRVSHTTSGKPDIVDTAVAAGQFNTLVAAAQAAGLVDTLKGEGPLTVFAPTDEAFAKIPAETLESLLQPENVEQLRSILAYHVVPGRVLAKDVVTLRGAKTVQGGEIAVGVAGDRVFFNNAQLVKADIETSNGVIHVIDTVLMPGK
ncbi:MAG: fasciclin domain-containing protein [Planctomycetota bacterium]